MSTTAVAGATMGVKRQWPRQTGDRAEHDTPFASNGLADFSPRNVATSHANAPTFGRSGSNLAHRWIEARSIHDSMDRGQGKLCDGVFVVERLGLS